MDFFWTDIPVDDGEKLVHEIEDLSVVIHREGDELTLASLKPEEQSLAEEDIPWKRFVTGGENIKVRFTPRTPDKPVVVNTVYPVQILPGQHARFFILLPAWIELSIQKNHPVVLSEFPSETLSATWFGGPLDGILSYSVRTPAIRRTDESKLPDPGELKIIAPLSIRNRSEDLLSLEDLNIHCENLRVYQGSTRNWTNEIHISYYGGNQPSRVTYSDKKPSFEEMAKGHSPARVKLRQDLLAMSYSFLRNITA